MARTYRKVVKCGVCTGSNTKYYRNMNRKCRAKNRHTLRNMIANYDIDNLFDYMPAPFVPIHDSWNEPTDGTFLVRRNDKNSYKYDSNGSETKNRHYGTGENYWNHKFGKHLKSKKSN